jgi:hypothetical protein
MEPLTINETNETPEINFDGESGLFSISGKSYPENVYEFYQVAFDYIDIYKSKPQEKTVVEFKWLYYNTATSKIIVKIILALKDVSKEFEVKWYCKKEVDLLVGKGNEIKDVLGINLTMVYI